MNAEISFLAPALIEDALDRLVVDAMTASQRPLDGQALAEAQRERESATAT